MTQQDRIEAYFAKLARDAGTAAVTRAEADAILDLAREVAHNVERKYAPIAAYALGLAVGAAEPAARIDAAQRVIDTVNGTDGGG
jgi:hypothetical protein